MTTNGRGGKGGDPLLFREMIFHVTIDGKGKKHRLGRPTERGKKKKEKRLSIKELGCILAKRKKKRRKRGKPT